MVHHGSISPHYFFPSKSGGLRQWGPDKISPPVLSDVLGIQGFSAATRKVIDCMPYFLGSGGEHAKQNKIRLLSEIDLQPGHKQIVCIILGRWQQELVPALSCWHNSFGVNQRCMFLSVFSKSCFGLSGGIPWKMTGWGGGEKPSSLATTAAAQWVPPPLNRCVHKMRSRDVWCVMCAHWWDHVLIQCWGGLVTSSPITKVKRKVSLMLCSLLDILYSS